MRKTAGLCAGVYAWITPLTDRVIHNWWIILGLAKRGLIILNKALKLSVNKILRFYLLLKINGIWGGLGLNINPPVS